MLYEAPSAKAVGPDGPRPDAQGSGIISIDNDDATAATSWDLYREAGLDRGLVLAWNVVPWYVGGDKQIRGVVAGDLDEAQPYLGRLLSLLPELRVVLAVGTPARDGWLRYLLRPDAPLIPTLACPHPSRTNLNTRPHLRADILLAFQRVAAIVTP